jgi:hypothetical protein
MPPTSFSGPTHLREMPSLIGQFLRDPLGTVRKPLNFSWVFIFVLLAVSALISGAAAGAITHNVVDFLIGLFIFPLTSIVSAIVFGFFIYYFFSLFQSTFLDYRRLMSLVSVALVPYFLFHAVSSYLSPIDLVGFAFTCILLIVGLVEQFGLDRKICARLIVGLAILFFIVWSISQIKTSGQI